jgi:hypothetical protein
MAQPEGVRLVLICIIPGLLARLHFTDTVQMKVRILAMTEPFHIENIVATMEHLTAVPIFTIQAQIMEHLKVAMGSMIPVQIIAAVVLSEKYIFMILVQTMETPITPSSTIQAQIMETLAELIFMTPVPIMDHLQRNTITISL